MNIDHNIIYGNYIPFIHEKGSYEELYHRYSSSHRKCPKCGGTNNSQTLVAYILNPNDYESYQDKNHVRCECGWEGIVHDLV